MEALGTALLTDEIPAARATTTIVSRVEIAEALRLSSPELYLDLEQGDDRSTVGIRWTHDELEQLLDRAGGDDILFAFDRDQLQLAFDDVEAHGLRERALVFTVAVAGALGSSAAIANAAPVIERGSDGAATVASVQALAADSAGGITSSWANVQSEGSLSVRQRRNRPLCRKRPFIIPSNSTSQTRSISSGSHDKSLVAFHRLGPPGMRAPLAAASVIASAQPRHG